MSVGAIVYCPQFERLATDLMAGSEFAEIEPMGGTGTAGGTPCTCTGPRDRQGVRRQCEGRLGRETAGELQTHFGRRHKPDVAVFVSTRAMPVRSR